MNKITASEFTEILKNNKPIQTTQTIPGKFGASPTEVSRTYPPLTSQLNFKGLEQYPQSEMHQLTATAEKNLPKNFSWKGKEGIFPAGNQGCCGSCWAYSTSTAVSDVYYLSGLSDKSYKPEISPTYAMMWKDQNINGGCNGGDPGTLLQKIKTNGIGTSNCVDYSWINDQCQSPQPSGSVLNNLQPKSRWSGSDDSRNFCWNKGNFPIIKVNDAKVAGLSANPSDSAINGFRTAIKGHIYKVGPIVGAFPVLQNFMSQNGFSSTKGVYFDTYDYNNQIFLGEECIEGGPCKWLGGGHAIVIVGWGETTVNNKKVSYWVCRNSWNDPKAGVAWNKENDGFWYHAMYPMSNELGNKKSQFETPAELMLEQSTCKTIGKTGKCSYDTAEGQASNSSLVLFHITEPVFNGNTGQSMLGQQLGGQSASPKVCGVNGCGKELYGVNVPNESINPNTFFQAKELPPKGNGIHRGGGGGGGEPSPGKDGKNGKLDKKSIILMSVLIPLGVIILIIAFWIFYNRKKK